MANDPISAQAPIAVDRRSSPARTVATAALPSRWTANSPTIITRESIGAAHSPKGGRAQRLRRPRPRKAQLAGSDGYCRRRRKRRRAPVPASTMVPFYDDSRGTQQAASA